MYISELLPATQTEIASPQSPAGKTPSKTSFADELKEKIMEVNQLQHEANAMRSNAAIEGPTNMHETLIKVEEASISLQMMLKMRNKAVDAYHEVMRMQF